MSFSALGSHSGVVRLLLAFLLGSNLRTGQKKSVLILTKNQENAPEARGISPEPVWAHRMGLAQILRPEIGDLGIRSLTIGGVGVGSPEIG